MKSGIMKNFFMALALLCVMLAAGAQPFASMLVLSTANNHMTYPSLKAELGINNVAEISWYGVKSTKVLRYELEKSSDGEHFSYVTAVPCGTKQEGQYKIKDQFLFEGSNYYRLKIVDAKGNYAYTNTVSFNSSELGKQIKVLSTMADKSLIIWTPANTIVTKALVTDMLNSNTMMVTPVSANTNLCTISVDGLKSGLYKITLHTNNGVFTNLKFSKK